jgi:hypothetical protein
MREMDSIPAVPGERECLGVLACFSGSQSKVVRRGGRWSSRRTSDFTAKQATTMSLDFCSESSVCIHINLNLMFVVK